MSKFDIEPVYYPVEDIVVGSNIKNVRTVFNRDSIEELADTIQRDGLYVPLIVMELEDEDGDPLIELIAGERRFKAINSIKKRNPEFMEEGVPCIHFEGTVHEAQFVNVSENVDREELDQVDLSAWIYERVQDGVTQSEIASKLSKSAQWVSFRVTFFDKACDELKEALREGIITFTAAYELAKNLSPEDQAKRVEKARRAQAKISLSEARVAGSSTKSATPGKKKRMGVLKRADAASLDKGSEVAKGIAFGLRYVDGFITEDEMEDILSFEETK